MAKAIMDFRLVTTSMICSIFVNGLIFPFDYTLPPVVNESYLDLLSLELSGIIKWSA